ncbi:hypothetical protein [Aquisalimonas asiatica]|uniref:MSHA biogenesis protein MshK n=1 Tax=Aquisalimonas asiatica TaxID=406100 RepID=A0A1H8VK18_9GAMM|nr:hypothetical protein [Aquisalimonas asiatica]SEP15624.1 hypothetical protein SAMN04488052_11312 [Aquisalimonas asiatica]
MKTRALLFCTAAVTVLLLPVVGAADGDALFASPLEAEEMDAHRGMSSQYHAQLGLLSGQAVLTDNEIGTAYTGDNNVSHGAFSDVHGITSVIQNSGNHVIIQDSTVLNVTVSQ